MPRKRGSSAFKREVYQVVFLAPVKRLFAPENRQWLIAAIVACAFFMELLDGSVIATALPQMAQSFHENPVNLSIGMSAYLLTLAIFIPSSATTRHWSRPPPPRATASVFPP